MATLPLWGERLKKLRTLKHFTQKDLANRLNVTKNYITMIERGKRYPTADLWMMLADILEVDVQQLASSAKNCLDDELNKYFSNDLVAVHNQTAGNHLNPNYFDMSFILWLFNRYCSDALPLLEKYFGIPENILIDVVLGKDGGKEFEAFKSDIFDFALGHMSEIQDLSTPLEQLSKDIAQLSTVGMLQRLALYQSKICAFLRHNTNLSLHKSSLSLESVPGLNGEFVLESSDNHGAWHCFCCYGSDKYKRSDWYRRMVSDVLKKSARFPAGDHVAWIAPDATVFSSLIIATEAWKQKLSSAAPDLCIILCRGDYENCQIYHC